MKKIKVVIASLLVLVLLASPAMAGVAANNFISFSNTDKIWTHELKTESEVAPILDIVMTAPAIKQLQDKLLLPGYELTDKLIVNWKYQDYSGYSGMLTFGEEGNESALSIVFALYNGEINKCGAILNTGVNTQTYYDYYEGKIYNTASAIIGDKATTVTWIEGPFISKSAKAGETETIPNPPQISAAQDDCYWCNFICNMLWGGGCSVWGVTRCGGICGGVNPCAAVCAVIYGVLCGALGGAFDCSEQCPALGFC